MARAMNSSLSKHAVDFINDEHLSSVLKCASPDPPRVREVIAKSLAKEPLQVEETATLLAADDPDLVEEIFEAARDLKKRV